MHPDSATFHSKLALDKAAGRDAANAFIRTHGLTAARGRANRENLQEVQARAEYGYWAGWIDACVEV